MHKNLQSSKKIVSMRIYLLCIVGFLVQSVIAVFEAKGKYA